MCHHDGLPGGIGVSLLRVYDSTAPDGLVGGSPHVHLACSEGYYVVAGTGAVQTLSTGGYAETALEPGAVVWFGPGTIHRLVNTGGLTILTLMSNSGLPEAGDAVLTFPAEHLADRAAYDLASQLDSLENGTEDGTGGSREDGTETAAMRRRDLALSGYLELRDGGPEALDAFLTAAVELVRPLVGEWRERWRAGAKRLADETGAALDGLDRGDGSHLRRAGLNRLPAPTEQVRFGMCGRLAVYDLEQAR